MTVSADLVARELRKLLPGVDMPKIHKLLYYCQGWHLAWTGGRLFHEDIEARARGPMVARLRQDESNGRTPSNLTNAELGTIGYVASRYGGLSRRDLIHLTRSESPWRDATESSVENASLSDDALREFFGDDEEKVRADALWSIAMADPDAKSLFEAAAERLQREPGSPDDPDELRTRLSAAS